MTKYNSVEELMQEIKEEEIKHPIRVWLWRLYWSVIRYLETIPRNIKYFIQRGKRGYADCDVWGFDYYLAKVIVGGLTNLKQHKQGIPCELSAKYKGNYKKAEKEWDKKLTTMIVGFQAVLDFHDGEDIGTKEFIKAEIKLKTSLELLKTYYFNLWD